MISFVTPKPEAAFSTLATRKSIPIDVTSSGTRSRTARRPGDPKMSATKRMFTGLLFRVFHGARFADDDHLDLAGILELPLDAPRHVVRQLERPRVVDDLRLD